MNVEESLIKDIGEQGLLKIVQRFCPQDIIGDDAAVIPSPDAGKSLVVTTDILVDGVHFSDRTTTPYDVGWRCVAANLSDLAAMGASPLGITVGLSLRSDVPVSWVEKLYQGMTQCLDLYHTPIVGGDICRSPIITVSITAFGQVFPNYTILRSTAKVGDVIMVTGVHGASRAGLELLLNPALGKSLNKADRLSLIRDHQRPKPRLDILPLLKSKFPIPIGHPLDHSDRASAGPFPISGMDSSDGLADAIAQICRASKVGAIIERSQIPIPPPLNQLVAPQEVWDWVLYGGEDFELVLCLPNEFAQFLVQELGDGAAIIGYITSGEEVLLIDSSRVFGDEILTVTRGFQHF